MRFGQMRHPALLVLALLVGPAVAGHVRYPPSQGESARYACADGSAIEVLYGAGDVVVVTVASATVELPRTAADAGERYDGSGWTWWSRSPRAGTLSRSGGPAVRCDAR